MLKLENTEIVGWDAAIRGMRNPKNSWAKSDSGPAVACTQCGRIEREGVCRAEGRDCTGFETYSIGPNDWKLMTALRDAGTDHRKFLRMIVVYVDILAPLYWWKEFDTYKVGTVANSCSTMHKIADKEFTLDDFSHEHLLGVDAHDEKADFVLQNLAVDCSGYQDESSVYTPLGVLGIVVEILNKCRCQYLTALETEKETGLPAKDIWWQMIQLLPSSYNQRRTVMLDYEVLARMYQARRNHKLDEWHTLCDWIEGLPNSELITGKEPVRLPGSALPELSLGAGLLEDAEK